MRDFNTWKTIAVLSLNFFRLSSCTVIALGAYTAACNGIVFHVVIFVHVTDDPIISRLGELKLGKQEDIMKSCPTTDKEDSDSEFSSESDKGSINDGEHCGATDHSNKAEASVELKGEVCQFYTQFHYKYTNMQC